MRLKRRSLNNRGCSRRFHFTKIRWIELGFIDSTQAAPLKNALAAHEYFQKIIFSEIVSCILLVEAPFVSEIPSEKRLCLHTPHGRQFHQMKVPLSQVSFLPPQPAPSADKSGVCHR